jgi:hypothetical protein
VNLDRLRAAGRVLVSMSQIDEPDLGAAVRRGLPADEVAGLLITAAERSLCKP